MNLIEVENYTPNIYQIDPNDDVLGGPNGPANIQPSQLADRTKWLRARVLGALRMEDINPVTGNYAIIAADIGRVVSIVNPGITSLALPPLAGFPKYNPFTIVVADIPGAPAVHLVANGAEVTENILNSGDGTSNYLIKSGTRMVIVATPTSWVVVLKSEVAPIPVPGFMPGDVVHSAAPLTARPGFFVANGAAVSRVDYPDLFLAIGTLYGYGDAATTFNLPDYRDGFLRVHNGGKGLDPGRAFGSYQDDMIEAHSHSHKRTRTDALGLKYENNSLKSGGDRGLYTGDDATTGLSGGSETRPKNNSINSYIKY